MLTDKSQEGASSSFRVCSESFEAVRREAVGALGAFGDAASTYAYEVATVGLAKKLTT